MKRRGAWVALAGVVLAACVAFSSTASAQEDVYENIGGLQWSGTAGVGGARFPAIGGGNVLAGFGMANATLNPNGIGQYLVGPYYDVRPVDGDAQVVNINIVNTNSNNDGLPTCTFADVVQGRDGENCYFDQNPNTFLPKGGILAKVRFRESKYSLEVLDFNIALSCGEVWAGRLELTNGTQARLVSDYPVVTSQTGTFNAGGTVKTSFPFKESATPPVLRISNAVTAPAAIKPNAEDILRGYIEVIGIADLPCEPQDGEVTLDEGDTWTVLPSAFMATNALAAEATLVRPAAGVADGYDFEAISRYRPVIGGVPNGAGGPLFYFAGTPPIALNNIFADNTPTFEQCEVNNINSTPSSGPNCTRQFNLAYSKSRLVGQYDISATTAGQTELVVSFPTKYGNCLFNIQTGAYVKNPLLPLNPFSCADGNPAADDPGELVTCTVYDRLENLAEEGFTSPNDTAQCYLPREVNVLGVGTTSKRVTDFNLAPPANAETPSGWVAIQLDNAANGAFLHREFFPTTTTQDILGGRVRGYRGLPAVGLVLQSYENGNVGGSYGTIKKTQADDPVLTEGQS